ncbi:hypothetical protein N2152v2_006635 [Parachlorella kessleri]
MVPAYQAAARLALPGSPGSCVVAGLPPAAAFHALEWVLLAGKPGLSGTWQPGSSLSGGSSDGSTSIDSEWDPAQSCPLHACLLQYGISNLAAFCRPRHLALSQEAVSSDVEPKLAALAAEGLSPRHLERLLLNNSHQLLACSYRSTFKPNLQLLRQLAVYREHEVHPEAPQLTAVGKLLAASTPSSARYLACDPRKVQQLVQWLGTNLDVTKPRLAGCSALCQALQQTAASVEKAAVALQEQSVPKHEVARVFLVAPGILGRRPALVAARAGFLAKQLQVDPAAAMNLIVRWPPLALREIEARLPPLLNFLDDYMGVEGAGQRLVLEQPAVAGTCADSAQCSTSALEAVTGSKHEVLATVEKLPTVLMMNLSTPLQQQKLEWIAQSPWPLVVFLSNPRYLAGKTRRLASRMAFLRESGLPPPASPALLVTRFDDRFRADVSRMLKKQGRELLCASWPEWLAVWLGTDEGKKWGFPPLRK